MATPLKSVTTKSMLISKNIPHNFFKHKIHHLVFSYQYLTLLKKYSINPFYNL